MYELLCIPEDDWYTLRENFIKENHLADKNESSNQEDESWFSSQSEQPFLDDIQEMTSDDPLITEAEKLFGKDFVEVVEE